MFNKKIRVFLKDKRSQIGETMTWVVATVIIIVILLISIFVSTSYLGKNKGTDFLSKQSDLLASKSFFAYLLTENSEGQTVHEQLKNEENLNDFNGNLAVKIFDGFYKEEYLKVWIGFVKNRLVLPYVSNDYFKERPTTVRGGDVHFGKRYVSHVSQKIPLNEDKSIELVLAPKK